MMRSARRLTAVLLLGAALTACGGAGGAPGPAARTTAPSTTATHTAAAAPGPNDRIAGLGADWLARIPGNARQVVVAYGDGSASATGRVVLYRRQGGLWTAEAAWASHNGRRGWTPRHQVGDTRSPVGVFTIHDAGGVLPDPGAKLPYHHDPAFTPPASWGPTHRHDFDYVIAIDYNRVPGSSPLDPRRPQGEQAGGGIWLHLDPGFGSSACVTLPRQAMQTLLRTLDPAQHPVVVMGPRSTLAA
ncbi:L,D-transpeptidase family protein [Streptacidiphilus griseoplanus]|uniref:L,D-transpeptidase family protein n=1 Tax=Peterkaempfera griseoplana TaxID=66896 RepID=UPI0006E21F0D|nr:L,D-transpeptidase family protein [Peterkaempfera griseoplana]